MSDAIIIEINKKNRVHINQSTDLWRPTVQEADKDSKHLSKSMRNGYNVGSSRRNGSIVFQIFNGIRVHIFQVHHSREVCSSESVSQRRVCWQLQQLGERMLQLLGQLSSGTLKGGCLRDMGWRNRHLGSKEKIVT